MSRRKARASRQPGLNAPPPKVLENQLIRQFRRVNAEAMRMVRDLPPEVLTDSVALNKAMDDIQATLDAKLGDDWVRKQAGRVAGSHNRGSQKRFFSGLEKSGQVKISGTDDPTQRAPSARAPSARLKRERKPVLVPRPNAGTQVAMDKFVDTNVATMGKLRENVTEAMREQLSAVAVEIQSTGEDPKTALAKVKARWRREGAPSAIPTRRRGGVKMTVSTDNHAALIARDQIATLNTELARARQTAAGIEDFSWQTQKDNRVRDEHRELQGTEHSWQSGANGVFPGEPINCRCWAQAVVDPAKVRESDGFVRVQPPAA